MPEREVLRIPSTRNIAIIGRARQTPNPDSDCEGDEARSSEVLQVLERELGGEGAVQKAAEDWIARIKKLNGGSGRKH